MSTQLTLIETSDVEADRIAQENQLIDEALRILDRRLWTCPYKTGHQLPVKLMLAPSA